MKKVILGLLFLVVLIVLVCMVAYPSGESGKVKLITAGAEVTLRSQGILRGRRIQLTASHPEREVKEGNYRVEEVVLQGNTDNSVWMMKGRGRRGEGETIVVKVAQTTEVEIGPPLMVKTDVQQLGKTVNIGLEIVGSAGEAYSPYISKDNKVIPAPKVTIMDESQHIVSSGKFEYG